VDWTLICGPLNIAYPVPVLVINAYNCTAPPSRPGEPPRIYIPPWHPEGPGFTFSVGTGGTGPGWQAYNHLIHPVIRSTGPSYAPTNNCACDAGSFKPDCLKVEGGFKVDMPGKVKDVVSKFIPPYMKLEGVKLKNNVSGQMCTCCENGIKGLKGKAEFTSEIEVKAILGFAPTNTASITVPELGEVSVEAELMVGIEAVLYGNVRLSMESECHLKNWKVCLATSLGTKATAGIRGSAKFKGKAPDGSTVQGGGKLLVGFELSGSISAQGCSDGKVSGRATFGDVVFKAEAEGSLKSGSREYYVKSGYSHTIASGFSVSVGNVAGAAADPAGPDLTADDLGALFGMAPAQTGDNPAASAGSSSGHAATATQAPARPLYDTSVRRNVTYASTPPVPAPVERELPTRGRAGKAGGEKGVCAQVRLQIEQSAVLTRKAVGATLEISNESDDPLEELEVNLAIYDPQGELANDKFVVLTPELTGIAIAPPEGATNELTLTRDLWKLAAGATGKARWIILPRDDAAPTEPLVYTVGGSFSYVNGGVPTSSLLVPGPVTVYPNAKLTLKYFHQREVFSDDPFTDEVEPAEPFSLVVMAHNIGKGLAKNFSITSAQPKIIENEKGLLIDFDIIATEVAGQNLSPSLTAVFGNLNPGDIKIARWLMKSSLLGFFLDYSATFEHEDSLGGRETSLIDSVEIHEMIHIVRALGALDDGKPDFLVNDTRDDLNLPDILYLSNDTTQPVASVLEGTTDATPSESRLSVQLTAVMPPGWTYLRIPEPSNGRLRLVSVRRSDGLELPVDVNVWITRYTFTRPGQRPTKENTLHLLDQDSGGIYTLTYEPLPKPDLDAPSSAVKALAAESPVHFPVQWTGQDTGGSGVAFYDIFVSVNGGPYLPWLQKTALQGAVYKGELGSTYAFYSVATDRAGNVETSAAVPDAQTRVSISNRAPVLAAIGDQQVNEGDMLRVSLSATDPDGDLDVLTYGLQPGTPAGVAIDPISGRLTWSTGGGQGGTSQRITVYVADNGTPSLSDARTFTVNIRKINHAPVLAAIDNQTVRLGESLRVTAVGSDTDLPPNQLAYSLEPGAPSGAAIDRATGLITWTPALSQAPGTFLFVVKVTDDGDPALSATTRFAVTYEVSNHPPTLAAIGDRRVDVGRVLTITNTATDIDIPAQALRFSLAEGAPAGAAMDAVRGVFTWRPTPAQGHTTNRITVLVSDAGEPPLSDSKSFTVIVGDYLNLALGSTVVRAGEGGSVPVSLIASGGLTNLIFTVELEADRLTGFALRSLAPRVVASSVQSGAAGPVISLAAEPGAPFSADTPLAELAFTARADQTSKFVALRPRNTVARADTYTFANLTAHDGRVTVVAEQPLLEGVLQADGTRRLLLYGKPWIGYQVQAATALGGPGAWANWQRVPMTNLTQALEDLPPSLSGLYFRAFEVPISQAPVLDLRLGAGALGHFTAFGRAGATYQLQQLPAHLGQGQWASIGSVTLTNGFQAFAPVPITNAPTYYRLVLP
jgi:hypothetical protein